MSTFIDKSLILNSIKSHYGIDRDADFARFLGIKPQTLASWYSRNTFDIHLLYAKCKDISGDWLLTGSGEMLKDSVQQDFAEADASGFRLLGNRFSQFLNHKGLSGNKAGNLLGETGSQITNIINGKNFGCDKMYNILQVFLDLDANYLFRGTGKMIIGSSEERDREPPEEKTINEIFIRNQQELIRYKDEEIKNLKKEITTLKKEYKQGDTHLRVAESDPKLK